MRASPGKSRIAHQLELRVNLLRHWCNTEIPWQKGPDGNLIRDSDGEPQLDFFPRGPSDFSAWEAKFHSEGNRNEVYRWTEKIDNQDILFEVALANFIPFSRTNLTQTYHKDLTDEANKQIARIEAKAIVQLEKARKSSIIEGQALEIKYLKDVIAKQEEECLLARAEARRARTELESERQTALNNEAQLKRDYQLLEEKMSALVRDFAKIAPITASKGKS